MAPDTKLVLGALIAPKLKLLALESSLFILVLPETEPWTHIAKQTSKQILKRKENNFFCGYNFANKSLIIITLFQAVCGQYAGSTIKVGRNGRCSARYDTWTTKDANASSILRLSSRDMGERLINICPRSKKLLYTYCTLGVYVIKSANWKACSQFALMFIGMKTVRLDKIFSYLSYFRTIKDLNA